MSERDRIRFSAGDVIALTGVPRKSLEHWTADGVIVAGNEGRGHGRHRRFDFGDVVAIAYGQVLRQEGAADSRVVATVRFLAGLGYKRLAAEVRAGRTIPVPGMVLKAEYVPGIMVARSELICMTIGAEALLERIDCLPELIEQLWEKAGELLKRTTAKPGTMLVAK